MAVEEKLLAIAAAKNAAIQGQFRDLDGDRYYVISNVDRMAPFFISVVSDSDHWLFVSSTGGLTAGRISPDTALFPYVTVDKIHESSPHTGSKTLLQVSVDGTLHQWEPFRNDLSERYLCSRSIMKSTLGDKLCLEEINHDLQLVFRYFWLTSDDYGFVRRAELENIGSQPLEIEVLDGLQNILPAGTPRIAQTNTSNLVDAYKWSELDEATGLATYSLYSGITDKAEPCESLLANTVFCVGLDDRSTLLSSRQLGAYRAGDRLQTERHSRGVRGAYLVQANITLDAGAVREWQFVADVEQTQADVVALQQRLAAPDAVAAKVRASVDAGTDELARIMAGADAFQATAEENVATHHYANVLFNVLRGGIFDDQYRVQASDFSRTIRNFNRQVYSDHADFLGQLPELIEFSELQARVASRNDPQLSRLSLEYLPITFGRRHGDPSRPWNEFAINLRDADDNRLLSYQGNWRDIFQNWEALLVSYPEYIENVIAKFVNASTMDGYNPYRITKDGIDWEVEEPDNPWSYIGYWGDHQIIYMLKFLEMSRGVHPEKLGTLLRSAVFCYANVPYRIRAFDAIVSDPKNTVDFDDDVAVAIDARVQHTGADGKLILDQDGAVYQVNLLEKLLVPLLAKLGNLVVDGGIWLNTQRPEWNDANNALVGQGLSMVTLYYLRRYVCFLSQLLVDESTDVLLSEEVAIWLEETSMTLAKLQPSLREDKFDNELRYTMLVALGKAASKYRGAVYRNEGFTTKTSYSIARIRSLLDGALAAIDRSIDKNRGADGLYHAYNLLSLDGGAATVKPLYPMLEGQVAALSAGAIEPAAAADVVDALFESDVYRKDQKSFMLYPDRKLPGFLEKNCIPRESAEAIPLLKAMLAADDDRLIERDARGNVRFNADLNNVGTLRQRLDSLDDLDAIAIAEALRPLEALYEQVFKHQSFTGRSGGMFGFEGLGSVYWHMVSKLLLAVQENFFRTVESGGDAASQQRLAGIYYRIREGIGFNKTPEEYGAFPTDPYSHTPKHAGARQPGMTGQVKEEILTRFGELGIRIAGGAVQLLPALLRECEFLAKARCFKYLDVAGQWREIDVAERALAFTWCQVPFVYHISDPADAGLQVEVANGERYTSDTLALPATLSQELFRRSGRIQQVTVYIPAAALFAG